MLTSKLLRAATIGAALLLFASNAAFSQKTIRLIDTSEWVSVRTYDGNIFLGKLLVQNADSIVLKTNDFGDLALDRTIIANIHTIEKPKVVNNLVWFENLHAPRYFAGTSAYGLRKGEGSYDNSELFFSQFSYGLSDHFSLGVGFAPFFLFFDGPFPVWVVPKFSFPVLKNKINMAVGGFIGHEFNSDYYNDGDATQALNAAYFQSTFGSRDANVTASFGFNFSKGNWSKYPIYSLAGFYRSSSRFGFLAESYFLNDDSGDRIRIFGFGMRFLYRKVSFDLGLATMSYENDGLYPIPYVSLHVPFGSPKN